MSSFVDAISVSDSDEEDSSEVPPREECEQRVQSFCEVTGVDSALAMFFLQERGWDLETAVGDYFQKSEGTEPSSLPKTTAKNLTLTSQNAAMVDDKVGRSSDKTVDKVVKPGSSSTLDNYLTLSTPVNQHQHDSVIKVLSWNIDGLDPDNLQSRTEGACSVLIQENPEVIFLQEVVERSLPIIRSKMVAYHLHIAVEGAIQPNAYFTVMLLRKDCTEVNSVTLADFPSSMMSRNLLEVQATVKGVAMVFLTSHLESTADYTKERKKQLKIAFKRMADLPRNMTVVFGGDLNLRDKELTGDTSKPAGVYDLWECTGKRPEAKNTWDLLRNDNKQLGGKFQPRCRFDRLYIRHSSPVKVKPVYFELVGIQRLASCRRFPSDHWGILAHIRVNPT